MRRATVVQLALGLSVGTAVPLAVVGVLLLGRSDADGVTVVVKPSAPPAESTGGLRVASGTEILPYLLAPGDLPGKWAEIAIKDLKRTALGSMDKAATTIPEIPNDCSQAPAVKYRLFDKDNPLGFVALRDTKKGGAFVQEKIVVFRPGLGVEAVAFLRGLYKRCPVEEFKGPGNVTIKTRTVVEAGPALGDESLTVRREQDIRGRWYPTGETVVVRVGDTVLEFSFFGGNDAQAVEKGVAKIV